MIQRLTFLKRLLRLKSSILLVLLIGCASTTAPVKDKLDTVTGVTLTFGKTPVLMYRDTPSQAAYARNFLHLGPIQVNRSGSYQYYLWIGIWNTVQTASVAEHRDGFDSIILFADGEPLALELSGWTAETIGASEPVYLKPVANSADAYYRVTADQIRLIASANDIRLRTTGPYWREFDLWGRQTAARTSLSKFLDRVSL
jgi:hypothetical protein